MAPTTLFALISAALLAQAPASTPAGVPASAPPPADPAEQTFAFAEHLAEDGDHYRAIGEYKRYLFLAPSGAHADAARFAIGRSYLRGGQHEAAALHYTDVAKLVPEPLRADALLEAAYARYVGGAYASAMVDLANWLARNEASAAQPSVHRARYLLGWSELSMGRDARALEAFAQAGDFAGKPDLLESVRRLDRLPGKSPVVAGLLSILPGAGHVYIGQPLIGVTALLWNGVFAYALYESIRSGQIGLSVAIGLFELLFYSGSAFGAIQGAIKYNRDVRLNALEELRKRYDDRPERWPPEPVPLSPPR